MKGVNRQDAKKAKKTKKTKKTKMGTVNALSAKNEVRTIRIGKGVSNSMWLLFGRIVLHRFLLAFLASWR